MSALPIPTSPTDNLYKFVSIAGLILLLGSPVYWASFSLALEQRELDDLVAFFKTNQSTPGEYFFPPRADDTPEGKQRRERWETIKKTVDEAELERFRTSGNLSLYARYRNTVAALSLLSAFVGLLVSLVGFRLWFIRVQRPQDQLLALQLQAAKSTRAA
jgi:hypothetical protein